MGSGKNIARLLNSNIWKQRVIENRHYRAHMIVDNEGQEIPPNVPLDDKVFCHVRVFFMNEINHEYLDLLTVILKLIVDSSGESFSISVDEGYTLTQVVIS